ncbi:nuclear pore complex protein Nup153-like isoform X1 [Homalodisca vitripennis]|uniref:nuclear pore complex protein Nup153-like isoform X1 n=1 Tax=Homalodisca vitripennis TaxID=197043 RepID=UPI001EEB5B9A|nr:nuclear pore complex protein Nup153-like isoform X1 [Homalodisca vitripennis]
MAKGSNNLRGRTSDASKPYDVSNSFVKRVASRMTGLLSQPAWLSRWMSPAAVPNVNDFAGHSLSSTITSRPPATSRAELNLADNVDHHVPAKKPRTSRYNSPINQNNFLRSEVYNAEDISPIPVRGEPVASSSSSTNPEIIASTPAVHVQQQNSTKVNGDDCSETSESTSGCSSLVPQAQSMTRSLGGHRYRTVASGAHMDSLHRRRPSFSTTTFSSPMRASMRERLGSSPFYSGRTMYGGSSQAYLSEIHSPQRRVGPTVKPTPAQQAIPLSSTAKRILDALEQFSTPVMDAKRIPVVTGVKRKLESSNQRYPELSIPSTPDLLRVKRRERLQQSTSAARQTATATTMPSLPSATQYSIRKEDDDDRKRQTGKVKTKEKVADEALEKVQLPSVVLSVDNLPKIDIAIPPPPRAQSLATIQPSPVGTGCKFEFVSPQTEQHNVIDHDYKYPVTSFKFSAPISETICKSSDSNKKVVSSGSVSSLSRTSSDNLTSNLKRQRSKDDGGDETSVSVTGVSTTNLSHSLADSSSWKPSPSNFVTSQPDVKPNSSCESDTSKRSVNSSDNQWECSGCKNKNLFSIEVCTACKTKKNSKPIDTIKNNVKPSTTSGFGDLFKKPVGTWECSTCMIQNKNDAVKCVACESAKPVDEEKCKSVPISASKANSSVVASPVFGAKVTAETKASTTVVSGFGEKFKKPAGSWDCEACMVTNKNEDLSCVACSTPKADKKTGNTPKTEIKAETKPSGFGDMFKKPLGSWTCNECFVSNGADEVSCVACQTVKPGATLPKSEISTPKFSFGIPTSAAVGNKEVSSTFKFGIVNDEQAKSTPSTSFIMPKSSSGNDLESKAPVSSQVFSFGVPKTAETDENKSGVTTSTPKPVFQFGSAKQNEPEPKLPFGSVTTTKPNTSDGAFGNAGKTTDKEVIKETAPVKSSIELGITPSTVVSSIPSSNVVDSEKAATPALGEKSLTIADKISTTKPMFTFNTNKVTGSLNATDKPNEGSLNPTFMFGKKENSDNVATTVITNPIAVSAPVNVFKFGETKTIASSVGSDSSSSVNTQPSFTAPKANNIFTFGSSIEKKEANFGTSATKETPSTNTVTLPSNENKPVFGSFGTTSTPSPAFGSNNVFGSSSFGSKDQPNPFVPQTTSNVFGTTQTTNASATSTFSGFGQTNANAFQNASQDNKSSAVFTFGSASTSSKESAPSGGGFVFNPVMEKRAEPAFGFSGNQSNPSAPVFGFNSTSSASSTSFNFEPKPFGSGITPFSGTSEAPAPVFGTPALQQVTPAFGEQTNPNPVFAFGSQPSQTPATSVFEFGSAQQQATPIAPAPSTTFVFGATPTVATTDPNPIL